MTKTKSISLSIFTVLLIIALSDFPEIVAGHGFLLFPNQRGALSPRTIFTINHIQRVKKSAVDYKMHFSSGDKSLAPSSASRFQIQQAGQTGWIPYNPFYPNFKFRVGICGDAVDGNEHHNGGKLLSCVAHHNGFMELYIYDADKCGGDISKQSILDELCTQLQHAVNQECDSGQSHKCRIVDPSYPGRWYLHFASSGTPRKAGRHNYLT